MQQLALKRIKLAVFYVCFLFYFKGEQKQNKNLIFIKTFSISAEREISKGFFYSQTKLKRIISLILASPSTRRRLHWKLSDGMERALERRERGTNSFLGNFRSERSDPSAPTRQTNRLQHISGLLRGHRSERLEALFFLLLFFTCQRLKQRGLGRFWSLLNVLETRGNTVN